MKPFLFKKIREGDRSSFWLIGATPENGRNKNYVLLINNDVIRIVEINFETSNSSETEFLREIISISSEDDIRELLGNFQKLDDNTFSAEKFFEYIDDTFFRSIDEDSERKKFFFFVLLIYEYIYNRDLKYSMPPWFKNSFLIKAIVFKLRYKFTKEFISFKKEGLEIGYTKDFKKICHNWLRFCLNNWNVNLHYPPILNNFPEMEVKEILKEMKNLRCISVDREKENYNLKKDILIFFLRRYDLKNVVKNLVDLYFPKLYKLHDLFITTFILSLIIIPLLLKSVIGNLAILTLFLELSLFYLLFFSITQKIFFPRALFGSAVAWTILASVSEVKEFPQNICERMNYIFKYFYDCTYVVYPLLIFIFTMMVLIYIISEMEGYIKDIPITKKFERALFLLVFIYSINFLIGYIFAYNLILSHSIPNLLKYYYLTSIASFFSIAAQIIWEDKPITEV